MKPTHPIIVSLLITLLIGQLGCSHHQVAVPPRPAPLSEAVRAQLGTIGVVSARFSPEVDVQLDPALSGSRTGEGAATGAITGTAVGAGGALAVLPMAAVFPPMLFAAGAIFGVSAVGGALAGDVYGPEEAGAVAPVQGVTEAFHAASAHTEVQVALQDHVFRAGRDLSLYTFVLLREYGPSFRGEEADYPLLVDGGIQSLLVVQVEDLRLTGEEAISPLLALDMSVTSRLVRTGDGVTLDERTFACRGGKRTFAEWHAPDGQPFTEGLSNCYKKVADRVAEELFLVYQPPSGVRWSFGGKDFATVGGDTFHPTFRWGSFAPLGEAAAGDQSGPLSRVQPLTYNLKVWRADTNNLPGELIYGRDGLPASPHRMELPLEPDTKYFWTVRARFDLDGQTRVSPWAVTRHRKGYSPSTFDRVTNPFYYHFTTPSD